jgi:hypothetical protein
MGVFMAASGSNGWLKKLDNTNFIKHTGANNVSAGDRLADSPSIIRTLPREKFLRNLDTHTTNRN